jgi:hypothetical protein
MKRKSTDDYQGKIYLDVKYHEKDYAKSNGAKWDPAVKKWFVFDRVPEALKDYYNPEERLGSKWTDKVREVDSLLPRNMRLERGYPSGKVPKKELTDEEQVAEQIKNLESKLQRRSYEDAVKELSAEFPEFEVVPDRKFYQVASDRHWSQKLCPTYTCGLHFKTGTDDTKLKEFIRKNGTVKSDNGNSGYLPNDIKNTMNESYNGKFSRYSKKQRNLARRAGFAMAAAPRTVQPWLLFREGEGEYIFIEDGDDLDAAAHWELIKLDE